MRPATSREADGPRNLADAIAVAAEAGRAGVVVVFAGTLHSARDVRKVHSSRLDAFSSGDAGPLGRVEAGRLEAMPPVARGGRPRPRAAAAGGRALAVGGDRRQRRRRRWPRRPCAGRRRRRRPGRRRHRQRLGPSRARRGARAGGAAGADPGAAGDPLPRWRRGGEGRAFGLRLGRRPHAGEGAGRAPAAAAAGAPAGRERARARPRRASPRRCRGWRSSTGRPRARLRRSSAPAPCPCRGCAP